jgi:hypothetical protein
LAQQLRRVVLAELPAWQLLVLAAAVGAIWAASLFDLSFIAGRGAFWQFRSGAIGGSDIDMAIAVVGYLYFVQSPWHLPLFYVSALGTPAGTNVILTDLVPIVALVGKLVHSFTGTTINLYGAYLFLCFALPGMMMTLVLIAAKVRFALAAILAAIFANATPALLWRWGELALSAHFLLIGALALYLFSLHQRCWRGLSTVWIAYLILTYLTDIYLFAMVGVVWICMVVQRRVSGFATTRQALTTVTLTIALVSAIMALGGQFGSGDLPFSPDYGHYSMNLASPVMPQSSGVFPWLGGVVDATGGQYEGFNYLGLGLLIVSLAVLPVEVRWLRRSLKRHIALFVACVALAAFAVSHRGFLGHWLLFELPLPYYIGWGLGIFRSSGRFFWLICYTQLAIVLVLGFRRVQPVMAVCLAAAAIVQIIDVQPLRERLIAGIAARPGAQELDAGRVARVMAGTRHIDVVPSFQCSYLAKEDQVAANVAANMELMLAAAQANVSINTVYQARYSYGLTLSDILRAPSRAVEMWHRKRDDYCKREIERARSGGRPGDVIVLLSDRPRTEEMTPGITCSPLSWARHCEWTKQ